jgi:hypothetical protein
MSGDVGGRQGTSVDVRGCQGTSVDVRGCRGMSRDVEGCQGQLVRGCRGMSRDVIELQNVRVEVYARRVQLQIQEATSVTDLPNEHATHPAVNIRGTGTIAEARQGPMPGSYDLVVYFVRHGSPMNGGMSIVMADETYDQDSLIVYGDHTMLREPPLGPGLVVAQKLVILRAKWYMQNMKADESSTVIQVPATWKLGDALFSGA